MLVLTAVSVSFSVRCSSLAAAILLVRLLVPHLFFFYFYYVTIFAQVQLFNGISASSAVISTRTNEIDDSSSRQRNHSNLLHSPIEEKEIFY